MKAREEYAIRAQMAEMHEEYIERMSTAYDKKNYVETVWLCYAIFEQRISRLIAKYIDKCVVPERTDNKSAAISTRIKCLRKLTNSKYGAFDGFDFTVVDRVSKWCDDRNELVHGLVSLGHYKQYDKEFKKLADEGVPLVFELYDACTDFRTKWYALKDDPGEFPMKKCQCKKNKCINPSCI